MPIKARFRKREPNLQSVGLFEKAPIIGGKSMARRSLK